jgi:outer membrane receptor protein involved in Fe transport
MFAFTRLLSRQSVLISVLAFSLVVTWSALAQSTGTIQGTVTDATGASVPNATVTVRNQNTGEERSTVTDASGIYVVPSLPIGTYRVEVKSSGMQTMVATNLPLEVGSNVRQDFSLKVAATSETVEITAAAPVVESNSVSVGSVVNQKTVQEIPLNGRHFVDLALLIPGSVTPPQSGFLTAPLRGQGSFAFNSGGSREDSVNYMINGINLSDPVQNQITFQPTINTVAEAKIDNSTFSAEYGRNSGAIVNIATRSGANEWHGELYDFLRNSFFDARNFTNPVGIAQAPFKRNQFGGDGGGAIRKDKTFFYLSYEGLRQRQGVPLQSLVLTDAQRAQAQATGDSVIQKLLPLIPAANSGGNLFASAATANVNIDQGTANVSHNLSDSNRINFYYAFQHDLRGEPPTTQNNTLPGFGDMREGRRQILTINDTDVISSNMVNEARLGYNRIHIIFAANNALNAADYGINSGVNSPIGLPQIIVAGGGASGGLEFGGIGGFPQGRGDYSAALSDTLTWTHGSHVIKLGGEYRRIDNNNFSYTPGTFTFATVNSFIADQATGFTANPSNSASRIFVNAIGGFVQDNWKVTRNLMVQLGVRYDWYGTPTEGGNRFVVFNPSSASLVQTSQPYNQSAKNFQPRIGLSWDVFGTGKTVVRSAYAIMTDQPITGIVMALTTNPPFAFPVNFAPNSATPFVTFGNAFNLASGSVAPRSIAGDYKDSYIQSYNFNIQQQLAGDFGMMVGYFGSKGTDLNLIRNYNQPINGVKPYPTLSATSPIFPGRPLSTILVQESDGNSNYNALWLSVTKRFAKGLQFNGSYTWSKSIDYNSRNNNATSTFLVQDSYNIRNDRGLSDFDARHRFVLSGTYELPFKGNRFMEGWELSTIVQLQTGNPINFHTTNATLTGISGEVRASVAGPVQTGFTPALNGAATAVTYIQNRAVFFDQGAAFGNLGRNVIIGPGFANVDFAVVKNTKLTERLTWQVRADAFDLLNTTNFGQPNSTVGSSTFGLITGGTRFPAGDSGSARQLQLAMKLIF